MPTLSKSITISESELARLIAQNYNGTAFRSLLDDIYANTYISGKNKLVDECAKFARDMSRPPRRYMRGNVFVLTGDFDLGKKYWEHFIRSKGGIVKASISQNVDYVVIQNGKNDGTRSIKEKEAKRLGIDIIYVSELQGFN